MASNELRKWLAIGSGVGIEIGDHDLQVTMVRVRPTGVSVLDAIRIERYAERPAGEWGSEYAAFLKRNGGTHLPATVLLPRNEVIVRQLALPGVSAGDLPQAIAFQMDGLHPFREEDAVSGWARLEDGVSIIIGITRRELVDRWTGLFSEAGVKIASLTFSAAAIYCALRVFGSSPSAGFLAVLETGTELEAYGESEARPVFSAMFDIPNPAFAERAQSLALSELRLPAELEAISIPAVLPQPRRVPESFQLDAVALPYAAAIAAACPRLGVHVNMLPAELRATSSRMMFVPTIILGALLLLSAGSLAAYSSYQDRQYLSKLQAEIARLEPKARQPLIMDKAIDHARSRTLLLDQFRHRTRNDLDVIAELTKVLEPPTWVNSLEIARDSIRLTGESGESAGLLKLIDRSPLFEGSEFAAPMTRTPTGEMFAIRAHREAGK